MDDRQLPSFYAILPSYVRYSRQISNFEKLLFAEIVALTKHNGVSWATNQYYEFVFDVKTRSVTYGIQHLADLGFIKIEIKPDEGNKRYIYLADTPIAKKCYTPIAKNCDTPISSLKDLNNTSLNTVGRKLNGFKSDKPDVKIDWLDEYMKSL